MTSDAPRQVGRRLRAVTVARLVVALLVILGSATVGRGLVTDDGRALAVAAASVYVAFNLVPLSLPDRFSRILLDLSVVVDAAVLAIAMAVTGGPLSPLTVLVVVSATVLTLAFGIGTGVRAGIAGTVALVWVAATAPLTTVAPAAGVTAAGLAPLPRTVVTVAVVWAVVAVTALLTRVTEEELRQVTNDLTLLRSVTRDLDPRRGVDGVCGRLSEVVVSALGQAAASVWVGAGDDVLRLSATTEFASEDRPADGGQVVHRRAGVLGSVLADGHARLIDRRSPRPGALERVHGPAAPLVAVRLGTGDRVVGLLVVRVRGHRMGRPRVNGHDLRLLAALADEAAVLLDRARVEADLRQQAVTDAVTGVPNHRFLQERLTEEVARARRRGERDPNVALSLALFDLDHFKAVNDRYGHPAGDRVLAAVASTARQVLRPTDVVCRYGGEEFAMILPDTDPDGAVRACERLRIALRELRLTTAEGRVIDSISASFGVATLAGRGDRAWLVAAADEALYTAKRTGRDRVVHRRDLVSTVSDAVAG